MKLKWLPSSVLFCVACQSKPVPEPRIDMSAQQKDDVQLIDAKEWMKLEGQWREVKKQGEHWKAELPCEGEGSSIIFSQRKDAYSVTRFDQGSLRFDLNLSSMQKKGEEWELNAEEKQFTVQIAEGILSLQDRHYARLENNEQIERVYIDKETCIGSNSFHGLDSLVGDWHDASCGAMVLQIMGQEFRYREEPSTLLWIQPEEDKYWLTLQKAQKIYGVLLKPEASRLQLWSGRYDTWSPINLYSRSKDCPL